ncbi:uncharacterized protein LOC121628054 [Melanotaenia boesemani]|uniref:uncharacterized protein LOC121628054 n=1 Tax=Melanotaenia boesemani TaxID=1250792 RepID=UPI001C04057D|nr:uncharacterized protein LOC121628054 [Melanotaenia boesemani]
MVKTSLLERSSLMEERIMEPLGGWTALKAKQEAQEARRKEDFARQEQRFRALQHQFQLLQMEVQARTSPVLEAHEEEPSESDNPPCVDSCGKEMHAPPGQSRFCEPRLEKLTDHDDIEHFLMTFERMALACRWPDEDWAFHLVPLLTGKARGAYVHMDMDDSLEYDKVKAAILQKYDVNPETYRQRFRSLEVKLDENPKELYARLKELYGKWIKPKGKSVQEISEIIILEQYLRMLSPELQVWIKEHNPNSAAEAAQLADVFVAARKKGQPWSNTAWKAKDGQKATSHYQKTDASERGLGAVLLQGPPDERHPVAFISRKLFPREVRYSTVEKEALAIKWALDSFRYYLLGREFRLETDHKALQWIERMKDTNGRITRWYLAIQPFRFTVNHIPGKDNCTADCLSRCPSERFEEGECVMAASTATQECCFSGSSPLAWEPAGGHRVEPTNWTRSHTSIKRGGKLGFPLLA